MMIDILEIIGGPIALVVVSLSVAFVLPVRIRPLFAWFDLWVGVYWDRQARKLYILPLPMFGFVIEWRGWPWALGGQEGDRE